MSQWTEYSQSNPETNFPIPTNPAPPPHSNHRQNRRPRHRQPNNRPPGPLHLLITQLPPHIPHQMPDAIQPMIRKREGRCELGRDLQGHGPRGERRRHAGRLQVPAEQRRDQVGGAEDVEAPAEDRARDPVQRRAVPGYLRLVDGEVRGDGPVQALLDEDVVGVGGADGGCCGGSGWGEGGVVSGVCS